MEFVWYCLYNLVYLTAREMMSLGGGGRFILPVAIFVYTGSFLLWLFYSGKAYKIRVCCIQHNRGNTGLTIVSLLIFPVYNYLTESYFETDLLTVLLTVSACVTEEVFFRGFLLQYLKRFGIKASVCISSGIFAFYHLCNYLSANDPLFVILQMISSFSAGLSYAVSAIVLDSIVPCFFAHFLTNLTTDFSAEVDVHLSLLSMCVALSCAISIWVLQKNVDLYFKNKEK